MSDLQTIADCVEIEALRAEFTERVYQIKYLDPTPLTGSPPDPVPRPTRESSPTRS